MASQSSQEPLDQPPQPLFQQLQQSSWFHQLLTQVQALRELQAVFDQECPLELLDCCRVLGVKDACLSIEVDNASWATQLQYRTRELLPALIKHPEFRGLKKIHARVARVVLPSTEPGKVMAPPEPVSPLTAKVLTQLAASVEDKGLKKALLGLVSNKK